MDEIDRKRTLMRELLESQGMSAASFTDGMIDDILLGRRSVDDVLDQFHSDDLKANIKKHPKEFLTQLPDFIKEKIDTDVRISSEERTKFKEYIASKKIEFEKNIKAVPPDVAEIRKKFAEGKISVHSVLRKHKIWRAIFHIVLGLGAAIIGVASLFVGIGGQEEFFIVTAISFYVLFSILNVVKFDRFLFNSLDQLKREIEISTKIEAVDRAIVCKVLDLRNISHKLEASTAEDFSSFFAEAYDAIVMDILKKHKEVLDEVASESVDAKFALQRAEQNAVSERRELQEQFERERESLTRAAKQHSLAELSEADTSSYLTKLLLEGKFRDRDAARRIVDAAIACFPTIKDEAQSLAHTSEEHKRVAQYETILQLYNQKIAKLRAQELDEEDKEEAIQAMKRLRDREIELLAGAEIVDG